MASRIQHTGVSADGKTCLIRKAIPGDTDSIRQLILSSSIHVTGLPKKQKNARPEAHAAPTKKNKRKSFRSLLLEIFASPVHWRNYCVAVSPKGRIVGCCQVKTLSSGIREIETLCLDSNWRNGTVAMRLMRFVIANNPHPLWGTCMDNVVAFQKRNGGSVITEPNRMPAVLRRRWRLFNFLMRLAVRKERLNVMMIDTSQTTSKKATDISEQTPGNSPAALRKVLLRCIKKYQLKKSHPFRFPGLYETIQGLFVSYPTYTISLFKKYFGKSFHIRVPDNNAFATFWTLELLLESYADDTRKLQEIHIEDAVRALMQFHDQTRSQDDPLFVFWKQHSIGEHRVVFPSNLMPFYRLFMHYETAIKKARGVLKKIRPHRSSGGGHPSHEPKRSSAAFSLPADFDDASLNWSLGSCLSGFRDACPDAWALWSQNNFDFTKLARHALECAYRPFADDPDTNTIDPRSFYAIRTFLWELQESEKNVKNFSLLTTWASTVCKNNGGIHRYYKMPFNVNNIDCSVQANFIHAACKSALNGTFPHEVAHFDALIVDTAHYVAWAVASSTIIETPDIALLYYPTPICAFFFISRIVQLLQNAQVQGSEALLFKKIEAVLIPSAREHITGYFLSGAVEKDTTAFWQRLSVKQAASPDRSRLDDRKFLTAASVTCLLNLWTQRRGEDLEWLTTVPGAVPELVTKGLSWLQDYGLSCSNHNAFFSASVKHARSLPFLFPANRTEHSSGPALQPSITKQKQEMTRHSVYAMSGVPSRAEYARMLKEKGLDAVEQGAFQKCFDLDYPYWSAPTVTLALVSLALSKATALRL